MGYSPWGRKESDTTEETSTLVVQWLKLHASNAEDVCSIPGRETRIPHLHSVVEKYKDEILDPRK